MAKSNTATKPAEVTSNEETTVNPIEAAGITIASIDEDNKTWSSKIRYLDSQGFKRADIARFLGKRYQHVRNVLEAPAPKSK